MKEFIYLFLVSFIIASLLTLMLIAAFPIILIAFILNLLETMGLIPKN